MKLLILTSALDLRLIYGTIGAWWYLLKALYEEDVDLLVTVYQGRVVPSPWWEAFENPCYWEGYTFAELKSLRSRLLPQITAGRNSIPQEGGNIIDKATLWAAHRFIRPRWRAHLLKILEKHPDVSAVLLINVPLNQLAGIPQLIHDTHDIPVVYYDPDMPISLPGFQAFPTGFRVYEEANLDEIDLFVGNSQGGAVELERLGARNVRFLPWAVDPNVLKPVPVASQDIDAFFYGFGDEYRQSWLNAMLIKPSRAWSDRRISARVGRITMDLGAVEQIKNVPFSRLRELCCRSKINLNIARESHTALHASSSMRPYELAALECCMVSNPYAGLEEWFEPGKEMFLLSEPDEVTELYPWLWRNEKERQEVGQRARERVLKEHTYRHRARQLKEMIRELGLP